MYVSMYGTKLIPSLTNVHVKDDFFLEVHPLKTLAAFCFSQEGVMRCQRNHSGGQAPFKMER